MNVVYCCYTSHAFSLLLIYIELVIYCEKLCEQLI